METVRSSSRSDPLFEGERKKEKPEKADKDRKAKLDEFEDIPLDHSDTKTWGSSKQKTFFWHFCKKPEGWKQAKLAENKDKGLENSHSALKP